MINMIEVTNHAIKYKPNVTKYIFFGGGFTSLAVLYINQHCQKFITPLHVQWANRHQLFKQSLGTCNVGTALLFWGEVASTDCITVYLGQGVFSSSSGLFTALFLPTGCWHRIVPSERLVTLNRKTLCFRVHVWMFEEMCRIVALFLV